MDGEPDGGRWRRGARFDVGAELRELARVEESDGLHFITIRQRAVTWDSYHALQRA
jgi:hypothetical protein